MLNFLLFVGLTTLAFIFIAMTDAEFNWVTKLAEWCLKKSEEKTECSK